MAIAPNIERVFFKERKGKAREIVSYYYPFYFLLSDTRVVVDTFPFHENELSRKFEAAQGRDFFIASSKFIKRRKSQLTRKRLSSELYHAGNNSDVTGILLFGQSNVFIY